VSFQYQVGPSAMVPTPASTAPKLSL
jgi:hypothetical protein